MPQLENNLTDDPIVLGGDVSFSAGQASNVRKNVMAEGAYNLGRNTDFDTFGNLITRRGVAQLVDNVVDGVWNEITDDWTGSPSTATEFSALKWSNTLTGSVVSLSYFDTPTIEKLVLAELVGPYSTGTASQVGSDITGVGTTWTSEMIGRKFKFADGTSGGSITGFTSATVITVDTSQTVTPAQGYLIYLAPIKIVGETGSISDTGGTFDPEASDVYFAQLVDRMYFCDGVGNLEYVNSSSTGQTITAGKVTSIDITTNGLGYTSVPAITFTASSGSAAAATAKLGYGGKVVSTNITNQGSGYISTIPPTIAFDAAPSGGTTAEGIAHISQIPSKPKLLAAHSNRLFCTSADTAIPQDTLYVSDVLDGESWDILGNSMRIGEGEGDPIMSIMPWFGFKLLVFKERSIWTVDADPTQEVADWSIKLVNNRIGCISHKSVQQVGSDVFFLSRDGVRSLSTIEAGAQTDVSTPLSAPINDYIERMTRDQGNKACSAYYRNRYMIGLCIDGAEIPNRVFVYNTEQKSWSGYWQGWTPNAFVVTAFSGKIRLMFGDETGKLYTWLDYVQDAEADESYYLDQTTAYRTEVISRAYNFGEIYSDKLGYQVEFDMDNKFMDSQDVNFYYIKDMEAFESAILQEDGFEILSEDGYTISEQCAPDILEEDVTISPQNNHFVKAFNMLSRGKFKEIQYMATTERGRLSLHAIKASAFTDTIDPQR